MESGTVAQRWRRSLSLAATAVAVLALVGCAAVPGPLKADGRTLLIHASSGTSASALLQGALTVDGRGCIAVGSDVLVVPVGSQLHEDGSITVGGRTVALGEQASFGGGQGSRPSGTTCEPRSRYWYV